MIRLSTVLCLVSAWTWATAASVAVKDVRLSASEQSTRVVFDLSGPTTDRVFSLHSPERVVIDLDNARLELAGPWPAGVGSVKAFRSAERGNGVLRIVLEVSQLVESRSFTLPAADGGQRLVIDIAAPGKLAPQPTPLSPPAPVVPQPVKSLVTEPEGRELIVAVDAGHGGQDPGASGRRGTQEKDITLAIARKLKDIIDREPGMRAVLTRDGDYFVALRERIVRARRAQADLFISIHADSVRDRHISGSAVYVLSAGRASNEAARILADRENAADLMGGIALDNKDDTVASVLLDLSQGASMSASIAAANKVLQQLSRVGAVHDSEVRYASLKVLTSPDMPSMLIETAFISNPHDEAKLNDTRYQQRLAEAIVVGIRNYFYDYPPPGTRIAQRSAQRRAVVTDRTNLSPNVVAGGIAK